MFAHLIPHHYSIVSNCVMNEFHLGIHCSQKKFQNTANKTRILVTSIYHLSTSVCLNNEVSFTCQVWSGYRNVEFMSRTLKSSAISRDSSWLTVYSYNFTWHFNHVLSLVSIFNLSLWTKKKTLCGGGACPSVFLLVCDPVSETKHNGYSFF